MINLRRFLGSFITSFITRKHGFIVFFNDPGRVGTIDLIRRVKEESFLLLSMSEAFQLHQLVSETGKIGGAVAEVGVFMGASAKIICEAKGDRVLYLFDTFDGLPDMRDRERKQFKYSDFTSSYDFVVKYLEGYDNVETIKGFFPGSGGAVSGEKFSIVHLDVDIYESTMDSLIFFYDKMSKGGIILIHDYYRLTGVKEAVDEFMDDKREPVIGLTGTQCMIVKL
ncbi:TylF/MycF/NovP-related O-methyltransferase [Candidatus Altiarchaeota archaeon]